jgi:uncharacterized membrane protein
MPTQEAPIIKKRTIICRSILSSMSHQLHNESKKEFLLERLILFSDAIFAIAITLLIIEIKIPDLPEESLTDKNLLNALGHLIPKFVGFLISFLLIGQYWMVHHRMFGFVIDFNERLIWLNILFLLGIVLMPFSTGFYSEYATKEMITPAIFYTGNIVMIGLLNFAMWKYIGNPRRKLSQNLTPILVKYFLARALTVPIIFILFSIVYCFKPSIAFWIPVSIPLILKLAFSPLKKKITRHTPVNK